MESFDANDVVIWGASGHARVVADILRRSGARVAGFLDDLAPARRGEAFDGSIVLGGRAELDALRARGVRRLALGVGDNRARRAFADAAAAAGFDLVTAVHPSAVVARDATLGPGVVIAAGAVVNPGAAIGRAVIVNTCASADHDDRIGEGASLGPGARLAGAVVVGEEAFIGLGAAVIERVRIGARTIVGAGAVVVRDLPDDVVAVGVPARVTRRLA